ncbi:RNA-binding S4 domain-containing protein [Saccharicrinis sp. FJH62]|uniref:RNA-binding S4 domain-containing protein n=1 Tax=Saccharicrinis sp. FJH62 TaxID=3344657 RepID=UPI0035D43946
MLTFQLKTEYIELIKLLKVMQWVQTGGHAKIVVEEGEVMLNGETEYRKRAKLRDGDIVEFEGQKVKIIGAPET